MSINAVTYLTGNTTFETGMVKRGTMGFNVKPTLSGSFNWWNKVDALSTQYLIYTDSYTTERTTQANAVPVCWSTPDLNNQSFVNLVNTIPERIGTLPFTSFDQAYNWLTGTNKYVVLKDEYENIVTDGLVLNLDAGWYNSYPGSGTVWTDLSDTEFSASLVNGTSFSSSGQGSLSFDGVDDYVNTTYSSTYNFSNANFSVEAWFYSNSLSSPSYNVICNRATYGTNERSFELYLANDSGTPYIYFGTFNSGWTYVNNPSLTNVQYNQWNHVVATSDGVGNGKVYVNGVLRQTNSSFNTAITVTTVPVQIGAYVGGGVGGWFNGLIPIVRLYNRALSAAEILQNYNTQKYRFGYTDPFTTDGLVLYWDAANPASYPGAGSTIYDLSGSGWDGTLYNGVGYSSSNGGVLVFDGVDDFVYSDGPNLSTSNSTVIGVSRYVSLNQPSPYPGGRIINARYNNWLMGHWNTGTRNYFAQGWVSNINEGPSDTNFRFYATLNNYSSDSWSMYVNDSLFVSNSAGANGPNAFTLGRYGTNTSEYSNSQFGLLLVYNRILNTTEMTQIYNYFKGRYGV